MKYAIQYLQNSIIYMIIVEINEILTQLELFCCLERYLHEKMNDIHIVIHSINPI